MDSTHTVTNFSEGLILVLIVLLKTEGVGTEPEKPEPKAAETS